MRVVKKSVVKAPAVHKDTGRRPAIVGANDAKTANQHRQFRCGKTEKLGPVKQKLLRLTT